MVGSRDKIELHHGTRFRGEYEIRSVFYNIIESEFKMCAQP